MRSFWHGWFWCVEAVGFGYALRSVKHAALAYLHWSDNAMVLVHHWLHDPCGKISPNMALVWVSEFRIVPCGRSSSNRLTPPESRSQHFGIRYDSTINHRWVQSVEYQSCWRWSKTITRQDRTNWTLLCKVARVVLSLLSNFLYRFVQLALHLCEKAKWQSCPPNIRLTCRYPHEFEANSRNISNSLRCRHLWGVDCLQKCYPKEEASAFASYVWWIHNISSES